MQSINPVKRNIVNKLRGSQKNRLYFRKLASYMEKPARSTKEVNLSKLDKLSKQGEDIAVPGKVLGFGKIGKKINVYALGFSKQAVEKIEKSGGKCLGMEDLLKSGKTARIIV